MYGLSRRCKMFALSLSIGLFLNAGGLAVLGAAAEESIPKSVKGAPSTHRQQKAITVAKPEAGQKLEDFCIDAKGRILALLGPTNPLESGVITLGEDGEVQVASQATKKLPKFASAVHIYDGNGKLVEEWAVGFSGQAINTAPDGTIIIGGDGKVARFDAKGKKLKEAESPQMTYIHKNPDEMRERAKEQLESDKVTYTEILKQFEDQLKEAEKTEKENPKEKKQSKKPAKKDAEGDEEIAELTFERPQLKQMVEAYRSHLKALEKRTVEEVLEQVISRAKKTHSITASEKDIFVSCPAMAGYGFGVWRTDENFGQAKEIIKSLSGCCGQMDVQCCNGELYVCENSRHRVVRFDREGKELGQFGKRDRTGEGENFGGCCNPMNLCFSQAGNLYVSESNGVVKHFTPEGKYLGIVGIAEVQPGCKNSCVGVTADDSRLFYIDIYKSQIILLARDEAVGKK